MVADLASSRRFSLALAAGAALEAGLSPNRAELVLALAEWREREDDATVRAVLDRALPAPYLAEDVRHALNEGWS